ncbi:hypothetical protein CLV62_1389 [Dysgonomonas alginatilytica]|uniref:C1q domain-containing protein n=1 Tax=Dysgonomonas alginatilytica TaxID=1605892 RepID=A0A2V3PQC8_9BACT|nr:hypothetical protein [Dysgonomonas alginatilytica]PXV59306.1 hypothetical protein CLV62_1389 [Dysgonomonas alginatilytica]
MTKLTSTFIILLFCNICIAQIGINTENPKALLHIDGASTSATTNPSTGSITAAQAVDDIVVTNQGNVGIGTLAPVTKLDITSQSAGGAIKIADTTQGIGKMLVSDANGVGTWASVIGSWYAILTGTWTVAYQTTTTIRQLTNFSSSSISSALQGSVNMSTGTIQVPYTGKYRVTIAGHWGTNRVGNNPYLVAPHIYANGVSIWNGTIVGYSNGWGISPTFVSILNFTAGNNITVRTNETATNNANMVDQCSLIIEFIQ